MIILTISQTGSNVVNTTTFDVNINISNKLAVASIFELIGEILQAVELAEKNGQLPKWDKDNNEDKMDNGKWFRDIFSNN
jgi:hypothetical protein